MEELTARGLKRVSPDFRVIALGLPVPEYPGFPIDPPLRSRFQGRYVSAPPLSYHLDEVTKRISEAGGDPSTSLSTTSNVFTFLKALSVLQCSGSIDAGGGLLDSPKVLPIPEMITDNVKKFLAMFPQDQNTASIIKRLYPFHLFNLDNAQFYALENMARSFNSSPSSPDIESQKSASIIGDVEETQYHFEGTRCTESNSGLGGMDVMFKCNDSTLILKATGGEYGTHTNFQRSDIKLVGAQAAVLTNMMQSHCMGHDICLVGEDCTVKTFQCLNSNLISFMVCRRQGLWKECTG